LKSFEQLDIVSRTSNYSDLIVVVWAAIRTELRTNTHTIMKLKKEMCSG